MKYIYIVNRFNLEEKSDPIIRRLRTVSDEMGRDYEILVNNTPAQADAAAETYRNKHCIVTAIGGDGSINLLLNRLVGTDNILSFIPIGTGNDFYHNCSERLPDGIHEVDIVRINERYFINAACFGIDADIANDENFIHNRLIPKALRYHAGVLYHFLTYRRGRNLCVEWEDQRVEKECMTVVAANSRFYGGGYEISPGSVVNDGIMELYIVDKLSKIQTARIILSMKKAGHLRHPALRMIRTNRVRITAQEPVVANIDGEKLRAETFDLELIPKGMKIYMDHEFVKRMR